MALEISRSLVEYILLGPTNDRRQLQDSPILGDVWIAFAKSADEPLDLLITPTRAQAPGPGATADMPRGATTAPAAGPPRLAGAPPTAGEVARAISERIERDDANIAYLQGIVAARLDFEEVLRVVVPMTDWWHSSRNQKQLDSYKDAEGLKRFDRLLEETLRICRTWDPQSQDERLFASEVSAVDRYIGLTSLLLWVRAERRRVRAVTGAVPSDDRSPQVALNDVNGKAFAEPILKVFGLIQEAPPSERLVWQISLNRMASPAIERSVPAVKADAARTLFAVRCQDIAWAIIDSGIDRNHPALMDESKNRRVKATFDFRNFRRIVSLSNAKAKIRAANLAELGKDRRSLPDDADQILAELAADATRGRPVRWDLAERLVVISGDEKPPSDHGTHVAGIIGASRKSAEAAGATSGLADGMCPDIGLYDFRVLAPNLPDTEFAVIAALQYIRYLNDRNLHIVIHGANLSLSIPHDVRNYACGRTPVCVESERLVESGVVVVAAAGNRGYQNFETKEGSYEGYAAFSVTDPGNADGVITVGSTHRYSPHTYGVSFFSSRGPTGDGRPKPDLVAPGERVHGPVRGGEWGDYDGTSMAAPHVSGAAAMLMARYSELIGQPRRIKRILCESATDLGRERSFQGHGMLDVLRAFQSI